MNCQGKVNRGNIYKISQGYHAYLVIVIKTIMKVLPLLLNNMLIRKLMLGIILLEILVIQQKPALKKINSK